MTKKWECPNGCVLKDVPCEHLEALLPKPSYQSINATSLGDMIDTVVYVEQDKTEETFIVSLKARGITSDDIELYCMRFIENMSFREIAANFGFTSEATARYYFRLMKRKYWVR